MKLSSFAVFWRGCFSHPCWIQIASIFPAHHNSEIVCTAWLFHAKKQNINWVMFPLGNTLESSLKLNQNTARIISFNGNFFMPTWSSLLMCRRRCLKKSRREHFLTRMRSVVPSARWAEGDRPFGLRGHAQLILAALMAINFPRITLQPLLPSEIECKVHVWSHSSSWPVTHQNL